jgi:hypothetical protein
LEVLWVFTDELLVETLLDALFFTGVASESVPALRSGVSCDDTVSVSACESLRGVGVGEAWCSAAFAVGTVRRCCGVGVSGVDGGLSLEAADGVLASPLVQCSTSCSLDSGLPVLDAAATSSSEDRFVCANEGDMKVLLTSPGPSSFALMDSLCCSTLSGSVAVVEGILKSSCDS